MLQMAAQLIAASREASVDIVNKYRDKETNIYVTDVRFPNEIAALAKNGFILVHIERPEHIRLNAFVSEAVGGSTKHASETALKDSAALWHVHILNDGTLEELYDQLDVALKESGLDRE